ncbi:MAG: NAD(P)H-dependent oxidoreductase [Pseudomonadota bacterium]|nr:NAD(P)H-dependent oxidoreductase [Pseudomonadota bacterium]
MPKTDHVPRHIVVRCHPEQESFNASMASAYCAEVKQHGHDAFVRDLYSIGFDPVLKSVERPGMAFRQMPDVANELEIIRGADVFVLIYPIWFGGPPAMLKGYIERVLGTGAMPLQFKQEQATGVLEHKRLGSFTSSATDEHWLATQGQLESLISGFDRYIEHGFAMQPSQHFHFGSISSGMEPEVIERHLHEVKARARLLCQSMDHTAAVAA